jgi:hypothetical protein
MIKALKKLEMEEMYLNIIKAIYDKPVPNITVMEKNETISSRVRNETWVSTLLLLFNIVLEFLVRIRQE